MVAREVVQAEAVRTFSGCNIGVRGNGDTIIYGDVIEDAKMLQNHPPYSATRVAERSAYAHQSYE